MPHMDQSGINLFGCLWEIYIISDNLRHFIQQHFANITDTAGIGGNGHGFHVVTNVTCPFCFSYILQLCTIEVYVCNIVVLV